MKENSEEQPGSNAPDHATKSSPWREAARNLVEQILAWLVANRVRRTGGWIGLGGGLVAMIAGLGPIGLSLILLATAMLLAEFEKNFHRPPGQKPR